VRRPALVLALLGTVAACARSGPVPARAEAGPDPRPAADGADAAAATGRRRPALPSDLDVLLVTIDALRADMPWTGYPRPIAPRLTALARESIVYTHAYALSSYTSMSLGGLLAARYPLELPRDGRATSSLLPEALLVPELLQRAGVRTIGVHGHVYFLGATGISQGFDDWRVVPRITLMPARDGHVVDDRVATLAIEALDAHARDHAGKRFFAWVHFMDPHAVYAPHPESERYRASPYAPDAAWAPPGVPLDPVGQRLRNDYDAEVRFTDAQVGRLLDHVASREWGKRTAIVVTSDHGEAFGEHPSYFEHGNLLHDVTVRVPLLLRVPGLEPARIDVRRSHVDLGRTLLELCGVSDPPPSLRGTSLVPELLGERPAQRDLVIDMPYTDQTPRRRALIHGRMKLVATETEPRPLLFDLDADPGEQHDLAAEAGATLAEMRSRLAAVEREAPDFPAPRRGRRGY
jgi:arylsulfatase A-like enzyme